MGRKNHFQNVNLFKDMPEHGNVCRHILLKKNKDEESVDGDDGDDNKSKNKTQNNGNSKVS